MSSCLRAKRPTAIILEIMGKFKLKMQDPARKMAKNGAKCMKKRKKEGDEWRSALSAALYKKTAKC